MDEIKATLILNNLSPLSQNKKRALIKTLGSAIEVLQTTKSCSFDFLDEKEMSVLRNWEKSKQWIQDLDLANKAQISLIPITSNEYPIQLKKIPNPPILLYVKGTIKEIDHSSLAIVGTRLASIYGKEMAFKIAKDMALAGWTIVSGLARGIDTAAHEGALTSGRTIAVIGCGLSHMYPKENINLADSIKNQGALISEFPMPTLPTKYTFPLRNRIISGLSQGSLLIEAPLKSGAMITVQDAIEQSRPIFALPGRIDQEQFKGNHELIKSRQAHLVESAEDILGHFGLASSAQLLKSTGNATQTPLTSDERRLLDNMPNEEATYERILQISKLSTAKLNILLMSLVLKNQIKEFPGKIYKKIPMEIS